MSNYQNMIDRITDIICKNPLTDQNYILVGDNSSGKSEVLRNVVERKIDEPIYFIDSVNRTFDANKVELVSKFYESVKLDSREVVVERISPFNYNLQDTFKVATCIEQFFDKYSADITTLCRKLLGREVQIERTTLEAGLVENRVIMNGVEIKLSSGYQALLRLFCEIFFFCDVMREKKWERGFVVIDEVDEYLSPKHSAQILN